MITIIDFYATWCIPCNVISHYINEIEINYPSILFKKIDIEKEKELTDKYEISMVPTIIILNDNEEIISKIEGLNIEKLDDEIKRISLL